MPDPRDYIDDDHEYVDGYVRRKPGRGSNRGRRGKGRWDFWIVWGIVCAIGLGIMAIFSEPLRYLLLAVVLTLVFVVTLVFVASKLLGWLFNRLFHRE